MTQLQGETIYRPLRMSQEYGRIIQREFPSIADSYRNDKSLTTIVKEYGLCNRYGLTRAIASGAVRLAIVGCDEADPPYTGLIPKSELERLCREHRAQSGRVFAHRIAQQNGWTPWSEEEKRLALRCAKQKAYQSTTGVNCVFLAYMLNHEVHGSLVRTRDTVSNFLRAQKRLSKHRKQTRKTPSP